MSSDLSRRIFIRQLLATTGRVAALTAGASVVSTGLTACSTLDEYLFGDYFDLKDQVLIIGGGISGLYLAYLLKKNKTEFRLLEGSNRFGGRIRSTQNFDLGASLFSTQDKLMNLLIKELGIDSENLDKKNLFIPAGMERVTRQLVERVGGLMPYRNLRLEWRLISIQKINSNFELLFETPKGRRTFVAKRIVLAIPPSQWPAIKGLYDLDEMKELREWNTALRTQNVLKAVFEVPSSLKSAPAKNLQTLEDNTFESRFVQKRTKTQSLGEVDFQFHQSGASIELQKANEFIRHRLGFNLNFSRMTTENYFDWRETELIGAAYFKNALPWPKLQSPSFHVIGDFASLQNASSLEGALSTALAASEKIL